MRLTDGRCRISIPGIPEKPVIIEKKSVLVAASNISPYTPITEDMITLAQIPTEAVVGA